VNLSTGVDPLSWTPPCRLTATESGITLLGRGLRAASRPETGDSRAAGGRTQTRVEVEGDVLTYRVDGERRVESPWADCPDFGAGLVAGPRKGAGAGELGDDASACDRHVGGDATGEVDAAVGIVHEEDDFRRGARSARDRHHQRRLATSVDGCRSLALDDVTADCEGSRQRIIVGGIELLAVGTGRGAAAMHGRCRGGIGPIPRR